MIDLNYLNHKLIEYGLKANHYICLKCNAEIWYQDKDCWPYIENMIDKEYFFRTTLFYPSWERLILHCEEMIIKNIIE